MGAAPRVAWVPAALAPPPPPSSLRAGGHSSHSRLTPPAHPAGAAAAASGAMRALGCRARGAEPGREGQPGRRAEGPGRPRPAGAAVWTLGPGARGRRGCGGPGRGCVLSLPFSCPSTSSSRLGVSPAASSFPLDRHPGGVCDGRDPLPGGLPILPHSPEGLVKPSRLAIFSPAWALASWRGLGSPWLLQHASFGPPAPPPGTAQLSAPRQQGAPSQVPAAAPPGHPPASPSSAGWGFCAEAGAAQLRGLPSGPKKKEAALM